MGGYPPHFQKWGDASPRPPCGGAPGCFMFSLRLERNETSKILWDFKNIMGLQKYYGTSKWDFKLCVKRSVNGQETRSSLFHPDMPMRS